MEINSTTFKNRFPEFESIDDSIIERVIDDSLLLNNEKIWGKKHEIAVLYSAAHFLKTNQNATAKKGKTPNGQMSSRTVNGVSVSYVAHIPINFDESFFSSTSYGQFYLMLKGKIKLGALIV